MFVLGLNRAHRSAGHALARTLVRAAILKGFVKQYEWFTAVVENLVTQSAEYQIVGRHAIFEALAVQQLPIRPPRLLNKLNVSPRDTQTSVCVM